MSSKDILSRLSSKHDRSQSRKPCICQLDRQKPAERERIANDCPHNMPTKAGRPQKLCHDAAVRYQKSRDKAILQSACDIDRHDEVDRFRNQYLWPIIHGWTRIHFLLKLSFPHHSNSVGPVETKLSSRRRPLTLVNFTS